MRWTRLNPFLRRHTGTYANPSFIQMNRNAPGPKKRTIYYLIPNVAKPVHGVNPSDNSGAPDIKAEESIIERHHAREKISISIALLKNKVQMEDEIVSFSVFLEGLRAIFRLMTNNAFVMQKVLRYDEPHWWCSSDDCVLLSYLRSTKTKSPLFVG